MERVKRFFGQYGLVFAVIVFMLYFGVDVTGDIITKVYNGNPVEAIEVVVGEAVEGAVLKQMAPMQATISTQSNSINDLNTKLDTLQSTLNSKPDIAVITLELDLNKFTTAEEVDKMMDKWVNEGWTSQQGLAKYIVADNQARKQLEEQIVYTEVFKRFILRARRIP